jgi:hypothetical protein
MFRKCGVIFCSNEHGSGDVTFPGLMQMDEHELMQRFIDSPTEMLTRRAAKAAGWGRVNKEDYCPDCMANGV